MTKQGPRKRVRRYIQLTLAPEALAVLAELAGPGGSRSAVVEEWLLSQAEPSVGGKSPGGVG